MQNAMIDVEGNPNEGPVDIASVKDKVVSETYAQLPEDVATGFITRLANTLENHSDFATTLRGKTVYIPASAFASGQYHVMTNDGYTLLRLSFGSGGTYSGGFKPVSRGEFQTLLHDWATALHNHTDFAVMLDETHADIPADAITTVPFYIEYRVQPLPGQFTTEYYLDLILAKPH